MTAPCLMPAPANQTSDALADPDGTEVPAARAEPGFSRDLVDTYFRQMGGRELLSREGNAGLDAIFVRCLCWAWCG